MSNSSRAVIWALCGVTALLLIAALISARHRSEQEFRTVSDAAAAIRRDLPDGTPRKEVESWLDHRQISRSSDHASHEEVAILHDVRKDTDSRSDLRMVFTFDDRDQLLTFVVEELTAARHGNERQERIRD